MSIVLNNLENVQVRGIEKYRHDDIDGFILHVDVPNHTISFFAENLDQIKHILLAFSVPPIFIGAD